MIYPDNSKVTYQYDKTLLKQSTLANGQHITWNSYQWLAPTQISYPGATLKTNYDALLRPLTINVTGKNNSVLMNRIYQYTQAGNIGKRQTEQGHINYQYDLLDRLIEAKPDQALQTLGLPDEGYTYDAISNRIGSRHQPGEWQYNSHDQLIRWGTGSQQENLAYSPTGQLTQKKTALETLDYGYNTADRLTCIKRNNTEIAIYHYNPFGQRISKQINGETTYYLYTDEGLIGELNEQGQLQIAYGWKPDSEWGTQPLWQANLNHSATTTGTLNNANYHYLYNDHLGTPQIAANSEGNATWQAQMQAFGETTPNRTNQITMNLRYPGQYFDAETGTHYNYYRDYNPRVGRYSQSDPIGLGGGINHYGYAEGNALRYKDPDGRVVWFGIPIAYWIAGGAATAAGSVCVASNCGQAAVDAVSSVSNTRLGNQTVGEST
ncbi:RHS repeat-associated core domain-containing protein [Pseudomonas sp. F1_0610]|uniref:RHS repeat domain-containing protein n=1 Tax=Pseudomonas sp. F1_0610 TaxID=3114284 RepID=UPI0039C2C437